MQMSTPEAKKMLGTRPRGARHLSQALATIPMVQNSSSGFPTTRRPEQRQLSGENQAVIDRWFLDSGITIGAQADTEERKLKTRRLLYTWRDCFAKSLKDVRPTDLIEHAIVTRPDAVPVCHKGFRYGLAEREFAAKMFPAMEEAGIVVRGTSSWGARTKFPPKKNGTFRVVHNFIPINRATEKPTYPMHTIDEVMEILMIDNHKVFMQADAANGYWAVPIRKEDIYKSAIIAPDGQWLFRRMGQGLKGSSHTYTQFTDLVFGPLPRSSSTARFPTTYGVQDGVSFATFMDDHLGSAVGFDEMFAFLHDKYFPRLVFGPIYLEPRKSNYMMSGLEMVGFTGDVNGLRPSLRHRDKALHWPIPTNKREVEAFCWITPFLRTFIPGRAEHIMRIKDSYQELVPTSEGSVQKHWVDKPEFEWTDAQQASFDHVKQSIVKNVMKGANRNLQYHLAADASGRATGAVLFQLYDVDGTPEATQKHQKNIRIIMFMSFKLTDAETRYTNMERECLAVINGLNECRWLVMNSAFPVRIYTDCESLKPVLVEGTKAFGRIARWIDRLGEFDYVVHHRPNSTFFIGLADGLSRMPDKYSQTYRPQQSERMAMAAVENDMVVLHTAQDRSVQMSRSLILPHWMSENAAVETSLYEETMVTAAAVGNSQPNPAVKSSSHAGTAQSGSGAEKSDESRPNYSALAKWIKSVWYGDIAGYLLRGEQYLNGWSRAKAKTLRHRAKWFMLRDEHLLRREFSGEFARCIEPDEVESFLKWAHDAHGHWADVISLAHLQDQVWWPSRMQDIRLWCVSCHTCQMDGPKRESTNIRPVLSFGPMCLVGMDFLGPISPKCKVTGAKYILVVVDYYSKFTWLFATATADAEVVRTCWLQIVASFGFPNTIFCDNASYFVGADGTAFFASHGVQIIPAPITHPSSVGQAERTVQLASSQLRRYVIERGKQGRDAWGTAIPQISLNINTRLIRIHGFSPAQILLGYQPEYDKGVLSRGTHQWADLSQQPDQQITEQLRANELNFRIERRLEDRDNAVMAIGRNAERMERIQRAKWAKPKAGDLVLIRNHKIDQTHGKKLDPRWSHPKLCVKVNDSGASAQVCDIYGDQVTKKQALDNLKVYIPREGSKYSKLPKLPKHLIDREAMAYACRPGTRAVDLNNIERGFTH